MKTRLLFIVNVSALSLLLAATSHAALTTNSWINSSGKWETNAATYWTQGVPSPNHSAILITNAGTKTVTIDNVTVASNAVNECLTISNLTVQGFGAGINTLQLTNTGASGLLVLDKLSVGTKGVLQVTDSNLRLSRPGGTNLVIDGTITLQSGSLIVTNLDTQVTVGNTTNGNLVVIGGTLIAEKIQVASVPGSAGELVLWGGTNTVNFLDVGSFDAPGTFVLNGGELTTTGTEVGYGGIWSCVRERWYVACRLSVSGVGRCFRGDGGH